MTCPSVSSEYSTTGKKLILSNTTQQNIQHNFIYYNNNTYNNNNAYEIINYIIIGCGRACVASAEAEYENSIE